MPVIAMTQEMGSLAKDVSLNESDANARRVFASWIRNEPMIEACA